MGIMNRLLARRFPTAYKHARKVYLNSWNHIAWLVHSYGDSRDVPTDPYNARFWYAQEQWNYDALARAIVARFRPLSILDVGCGSGTILASILTMNSSLRVLGLDYSSQALALARTKGVAVRECNIIASSRTAIRHLCRELGTFDLTMCLEVAEHLPVWHATKLLYILATTSDTIVFSAAQPGQGGLFHLNEQPPEYWIRRFSALGLKHSSENTRSLRAALHSTDSAPWYKNNLLVFTRA
jgi:SAM-dependent methyltransferase